MEIICNNCQSKFRVPDEKIPAGKRATVACPKCKGKISLGSPGGGSFKSTDSNNGYNADEKPFDFIEEEGLTALVCESNPLVRKTIKPGVKWYFAVPGTLEYAGATQYVYRSGQRPISDHG
jgi:predicted Zn finger-like uncharacterized protein